MHIRHLSHDYTSKHTALADVEGMHHHTIHKLHISTHKQKLSLPFSLT